MMVAEELDGLAGEVKALEKALNKNMPSFDTGLEQTEATMVMGRLRGAVLFLERASSSLGKLAMEQTHEPPQ